MVETWRFVVLCLPLALLGCEHSAWFQVDPDPIQVNVSAPLPGALVDKIEASADFVGASTSGEAVLLRSGASSDTEDGMWVDLAVGDGTETLLLPDGEFIGTARAFASCGSDACTSPGDYSFTVDVRVFRCTEEADVAEQTGSCNTSTIEDDVRTIDVHVVVEE